MTTNTLSLNSFDFKTTLGNEEAFFTMYRGYMNVRSEGDDSAAAVVHSLFLPLNGPKTPASTAKRMQEHAAKLVKKWTEDVPESQRIAKEHIKLNGSNPFASAFKKLIGAVEHGGDLNELDTISKCERFRREKNKAQNKANTDALIVAEQRALLIEDRKDLVVDSPEFLAELKARVEKINGTEAVTHKKGEDEGDKVKTPLDLALEALCADYRKVAELHGNEAQAIEMVAAARRSVNETLDKIKAVAQKMLQTGT